MTTPIDGRPQHRRVLSDELNRLDGIIDALADGLPRAVADAVQDGARLAVKDALADARTDLVAEALGIAAARTAWAGCRAAAGAIANPQAALIGLVACGLTAAAGLLLAHAATGRAGTWRPDCPTPDADA